MSAPREIREHGTTTAYTYGCRCAECKSASAKGKRERRARLIASGGLPADDRRHGTPTGYSNWGCRCQSCRDAWAVAHLAYMQASPEQQEKSRRRNAARYWARKGVVPFVLTDPHSNVGVVFHLDGQRRRAVRQAYRTLRASCVSRLLARRLLSDLVGDFMRGREVSK